MILQKAYEDRVAKLSAPVKAQYDKLISVRKLTVEHSHIEALPLLKTNIIFSSVERLRRSATT